MKMTRRQLAGLVAAAPVAARRLAAAGADSQTEPAQAAADELRQSSAVVRKLAIPAGAEPAFSFRAQ